MFIYDAIMYVCFIVWHLRIVRQAEHSARDRQAEETHRQAELGGTGRPKEKIGKPNTADEQSVEISPKLWLS